MTPLHYAARKQSKALMDLMIQYGANEYVRDIRRDIRRTAYMSFAKRVHTG